jgi:hypothetical protein
MSALASKNFNWMSYSGSFLFYSSEKSQFTRTNKRLAARLILTKSKQTADARVRSPVGPLQYQNKRMTFFKQIRLSFS